MAAKKTVPPKTGRIAAKVTCHWQGELVEQNQPIPASWPREYVDDLVATGGAKKG